MLEGLMGDEVIFLRECFLALVTSKWFLSRMYQHVDGDVVFVSERQVADFTPV